MRSTIVEPATVDYIWPQVERFIKAGFTWGRGKHGRGDETLENTLGALREGRCQLWVMHNGRGLRGAGVTKVEVLPTGRKICVTISYGGECLSECGHILKDVENFAKANGCSAVRITGRPGWRVFKKYGYKEPFICLEKEL